MSPARYGLAAPQVDAALRRLHLDGKLLEGEFRPEGVHREWCDPDVLQQIRRKTLARLRREVVPAEQHTFARMLTRWQGVTVPRRGLDALLDTIELLQGAALPVSDLEREILPARVSDYRPADLDALMASGDVVWVGREPLGDRDGRVALYLADSLPSLLAPAPPPELSPRALLLVDLLRQMGASFFAALHQAAGGGFANDTQDALWELVWAGVVTNDTFHPLRNLLHAKRFRARPPRTPRRSARFARVSAAIPRAHRRRAGGEGRWSLVAQRVGRRHHADRMERQPGTATAGAPRHRDARNGERPRMSWAAIPRFIRR